MDQVFSRCASESHPQAPTNLLFGEKRWNKKALHDYQGSTVLYTVKTQLILLGSLLEKRVSYLQSSESL